MEDEFQRIWDLKYTKEKNGWKTNVFGQISDDLYRESLSRAERWFYSRDRCKKMTEDAEDESRDTVFLKLITTEHYFTYENDWRLCAKMASVYLSLIPGEFKKIAKENGLLCDLEYNIQFLLEKRFQYLGLKYKNELE